MSEEQNIDLFGKVAKFPKNIKASKAFNFLENIKVSKNKIWYILVEKQSDELQMIKYNNKKGVNLKEFVRKLTEFYSKDKEMSKHINNLVIDGNDKFSIIRNIPNIDVNGKKLITILMEDLIKLLK